ncbi:hypothetical protein ACHAW5_009990 [Stephanodiscus triporus]|uniref:Uncharacterized protein n=1 Tax=Stephanodiscus triporus TaxID=2934178 RepID=A0ABD3NV81_9STRA
MLLLDLKETGYFLLTKYSAARKQNSFTNHAGKIALIIHSLVPLLTAESVAILAMEPSPLADECYHHHRERLSLDAIVSTVKSFCWETMSIIPSVLVRLLPVARFACWLMIYFLHDFCLVLAYILQRLARHAKDAALCLEAVKIRASKRSMRSQTLTMEPFRAASHVNEAGDSRDGDDSTEETDMDENFHHGVSHRARVRARSDAMGVRDTSAVMTKKELGQERVRAFHERRRRRGLKV